MREILLKYLPYEKFLGMDKEIIVVVLMIAIAIIFTFLITITFGILFKKLFKDIKIKRFEKLTQSLSNHHMFKRTSALIPPVFFLILIPIIFPQKDIGDTLFLALDKILFAYLYVAVWVFLMGLIEVVNDIISNRSHRYMHGFIQTVEIVVSLIVLILAISTLLDKSPLKILAGLGASAAVMMFIFKDAILGFVASVQLSANDMLQCGDWITMPKYGADGEVFEIGLTVVKVRNWDNTVSNIPTYALVSDSYQNWRGMSEMGARRVMRSISIDMNSVKFCDTDQLDRFEKIPFLKEYISECREFLKSDPKYGCPTNMGVFRKYLELYLQNNPNVILSMTHFVRQLQPNEKGIPIQLYFFTTTDWIAYENIQSDIFDHVIASVGKFDLRIFQDESDAPDNK